MQLSTLSIVKEHPCSPGALRVCDKSAHRLFLQLSVNARHKPLDFVSVADKRRRAANAI
jgi:hypothetical protein